MTHPALAARLRQAHTEAALAHVYQLAERRKHVSDIVAPSTGALNRQRLGQVYDIGDDGDAVFELIDGERVLWGALVGDRRPNLWHYTMDEALVHLLAMRHGDRNTAAHTYACRVLQVPVTE